jgi:deferrochelatase/peroxidase EfeB
MATNNLQDIRDNLKDIQGIVVRGYGKLEAACFVLLSIAEAGAAKRWLGELAPQIMAGQNRPSDVCANIAFSYAGLQALGLNPQTLAMFSREFQEGMVTEHRQRLLGDHGENAPERWSWGGPKTPTVHILLMLYAENETKLAGFYQAQAEKFKAAGLVEVYERLETVKLRDDKGHFGFVDGISQPLIAGLTRSGPLANMVEPGEFILGYPNEYGQYTDRPMVDVYEDKHNLLPVDVNGSADRDFGRNGSYLVFRQLRQQVREFWQFLDKVTQNPDGSSNPAARLKLASKMVGRWPSGAPLTLTPDKDDERWRAENDFGYHHQDLYGFNCPGTRWIPGQGLRPPSRWGSGTGLSGGADLMARPSPRP